MFLLLVEIKDIFFNCSKLLTIGTNVRVINSSVNIELTSQTFKNISPNPNILNNSRIKKTVLRPNRNRRITRVLLDWNTVIVSKISLTVPNSRKLAVTPSVDDALTFVEERKREGHNVRVHRINIQIINFSCALMRDMLENLSHSSVVVVSMNFFHKARLIISQEIFPYEIPVKISHSKLWTSMTIQESRNRQ